jgi:hypothetical protein
MNGAATAAVVVPLRKLLRDWRFVVMADLCVRLRNRARPGFGIQDRANIGIETGKMRVVEGPGV